MHSQQGSVSNSSSGNNVSATLSPQPSITATSNGAMPLEEVRINVIDGEPSTQTPNGFQIEAPDLILSDGQRRREYLSLCVPLYQAALNGDWKAAKDVISKESNVVRFSLTKRGETALHIAAAAKRTAFVRELVNYMTDEDLRLKNEDGNTAICFAAASGIVEIAKVMVEKNKGLPLIRSKKGVTPLYMAALFGHRSMVSYLYPVTDFGSLSREDRIGLFVATIKSDLYDVALKILEKDKSLAITRDGTGETALHILARKPSTIANRSQLGIWKRCINSCFKGIYHGALMRTLAHQLVKKLWEHVLAEVRSDSEMSKLIREPSRLLFDAAELGNIEFLIILIRSYPDLIWKVDQNNRSLFHIAVLNRHETIFNLIYEVGAFKDLIAAYKDEKKKKKEDENNDLSKKKRKKKEDENNDLSKKEEKEDENNDLSKNKRNKKEDENNDLSKKEDENKDNNMLHLAGYLAPLSRLQIVSGAALQMQRELLWFKAVEKIVPPSYVKMKNKDNQTPKELFTEKHKDLLKAGEKWMKNTATSCMLVATLIATVVFAAVFTLPGGNNQPGGNDQTRGNNQPGYPIFLDKKWFSIFVISDAVALFSASTAIITFLSILTSRYAENDFITSLPWRLMFGLSALFVSIASMVVAFSATFFLMYDDHTDQFHWVPILIASLACVTVTLFAVQHYQLWVDTIRSTYWSRFLFRPFRHRLYK